MAKRDKWTIEQHDGADKSFRILPPSGVDISIEVDYDDVDHLVVDKEATKLVRILDEHWFKNAQTNCVHITTEGKCIHPSEKPSGARTCVGVCFGYAPKQGVASIVEE